MGVKQPVVKKIKKVIEKNKFKKNKYSSCFTYPVPYLLLNW